MRLVAVSDTHLYEAELDPVPEGDVFIHAGDLLRRVGDGTSPSKAAIKQAGIVSGWESRRESSA